MASLKIVFAGTPEFAAVSLAALVDGGHQVIAAYTQPDRPAGRGRKLTPSPVKRLAQARQIPVYQPTSLRRAEEQQTLAALGPDLMIVAAYGLILPVEVLEIPVFGCINVHASLLPRWRGAAPIPRAIEAGDDKTGITIMQMDAGLDTGDMLLKSGTNICETDTAATLHDRLAQIGGHALCQALDQLQAGSLTPTPQDETLACYASKLNKAEARIDWRQSASQIARKIRAFNPWPVAYATQQGERIRIWGAEVVPNASQNAPGKVTRTACAIHVACGEGALALTRIQLQGGKQLAIKDFLNSGRALLSADSQLDCP